MPRNKVEWVKLTGRVSEELTCPEDVELVRNELKTRDQGDLLRDMVKIYRLYKEGKLLDIDLVKNQIEKTILSTLSLINEKSRPIITNEPVIKLPEPVFNEKPKSQDLPKEIMEKIETGVKSSSLLDQLQQNLKNGGVGPKS